MSLQNYGVLKGPPVEKKRDLGRAHTIMCVWMAGPLTIVS